MRKRKYYSLILLLDSLLQLKICLASLLKQSRLPDEVIFILKNNNYQQSVLDDSILKLNEKNIATKVAYKSSGEKSDFLPSAVSLAKGKIILFLNEYCLPHKKWIAVIGKIMKKKNIGIVSTKLIHNAQVVSVSKSNLAGYAINKKIFSQNITIADSINPLTIFSELYKKGYIVISLIKPFIYFIPPQRFLHKTIHYPLWLIKTSAKKRDGWWTVLIVDRVAFPLTWLIANFTNITPNQITFLSTSLGIASAFFFIQPGNKLLVVGLATFALSHLLDCVDGKLARLKKTESEIGGYIDVIKDRIIIILNLFALSIRNYFLEKNLRILILALLFALLATHVRLFSLYYHKIKKKKKRRRQIISFSQSKSYLLQFFVTRIQNVRKFLHSKRIKMVPYVYEIELMAIMLGALFNQLQLTILVGIVFTSIIILSELSFRFFKLSK